MESSELIVEKKQWVGYLTLNRPKSRNALTPTLLETLMGQMDDFEKDDEVRAVCITGAGEKSFCAGADLKATMAAGMSPQEANINYARLLQRMLAFPKPIVAKINGHCMGGGVGVALACDIAIAHEELKFGTPEVNVGLFPMMISTLILQQMPRKPAMKMMLCGEKLTAQEALQYNLLNQVVSREALDEAVGAVLQSLLGAAPLAQQHGKRAIRETAHLPFNEAVEHLSGHLGQLMQTADAMEGITAFMQKRKPEWQGK